ncbi:uncharacterized protein LOC117114669 [Anneissia japonica]|uniref:uncharacterized protein LOC117114669 n=1 Tax=Anneissia japonica TaxID=1529436 RepID=UPI001425AC95|nr:uncharacterized protein LOC117114669 [Anneissia japonica]
MSKVNFIVKINFCDERDLYKLPCVNKKRAQQIICWRSRHRNLTPDSLDVIKGVSRSNLEKHIDFTPNPEWGGNGVRTVIHSVSSQADRKNLAATSSSRQLPLTPFTNPSHHQHEIPAQGGSGPDFLDPYYGPAFRLGKSSSKGKSRQTRRTVESSEESESEEESDSESESEEVLRGWQTFLEHVRADQRRENYPRPDQRWEDYRHDQRWQDYYRPRQRWEDYRRHSPRQGDYRPEMCTLKPRDIPKNLIFKGKGSWSFFKKRFMAFTEEYELSPKARIETLSWYVEGPAADFYVNLLEMDRRITFKKILKAFDKRFGEEDLPAVLQARPETATQREDESVNEWGDRVMTMTRKAYKDLPNAWIRQEAATRFCLGCRDTEAGRYVLHEQVSTLAEALTECE